MRRPTPEDQDKFSLRLTEDHFLLHTKSGLYIQSESNSLHNGTRLVPYPRRDGDTDQFKFKVTLVDLNELQREIDNNSIRQKDINFYSSSDGRALAASNVALEMGNEERLSKVTIMESDCARIQLGTS